MDFLHGKGEKTLKQFLPLQSASKALPMFRQSTGKVLPKQSASKALPMFRQSTGKVLPKQSGAFVKDFISGLLQYVTQILPFETIFMV